MTYNDQILKTRRKDLRRNQTDSEKMIWDLIRGKKCKGYKFFRQYSVGLYILDFYCPSLRLSIEIDGGQHNEEINKEYDKTRTSYLSGQNIKELRFWNNEVFENLDGVYQKILEQCL
ncbi:MAG: DNA-cytosine methyltransferase [Candidatus Doudnabacteria bacterium RIFCSPLOWO2_01_FULL_44_21]|uniref:DNA-cytosine methyltransferase n=1 Tax=Candidatus Doudnabacteria bacterium RIFCSPLOWO2_01_FULL_44_21 TaxID=1817841 RepID=A0A1F5PXN0_9BACT|nr:MAG: DNA-cytosine methyltransferase [Candidatus Doudnabacteria bacterium RIFCSPHIGHO2_02_FULL_43_13b]OGE94462.1 MAG: DNA-cytosine methyltransferase [Candidatus Doudnabacteria bacterium RIFCSPLOWO2_01_FULL_44_21]